MKTVLIPTDYSENAHHALRFAFYISEVVNLQIYIFHCAEILIPTSTAPHLYKELYDEQITSKIDQLKSDTAKVLKSLELTEENKNIHYILKDSGDLDKSLVETLKENKIDLVVMGTMGATGLKKIFFGSNTTRIIEKAQVPVIAVPAFYELSPIRKIAYASDLKDIGKEVGELVRFAKLFNASIEIFHVFPSYPQWIDPTPENIEKLTAKLHETYPEQKFSVHVIQTYKENDILHGIETYIKGFKPDILAMFTVKRTFWDKLFDASRTEEFAFNATIPLLTLKKN